MLGKDFIKNEYQMPVSDLEKVERAIMIDILTKKIRSGQRLVEHKLCDQYELSRTPIRQVLQKIESHGLIRIEQNKGAIVTGLSDQNLDDILYMRMLLEPQAVRWAIERITKEEMAMLDETFLFMEFYTKTEDLVKMNRINSGFKRIIYDAAKNKEIERTLLDYDFYITYGNQHVLYPLNYLKSVLEEHRAIYEAFQNHKPEEGYEAAQIHAYKSMMRRK